MTDSVNDLLSVLLSAAPGQEECEDALRKISVSCAPLPVYAEEAATNVAML